MGRNPTKPRRQAARQSFPAEAFGDFTRDRIRKILESWGQERPDSIPLVAAVTLACLDQHSPIRDSDLIALAAEALARVGTQTAGDLLWQAAEDALNWRVRVEAIRRCGPSANSPARREALRRWATEAFQPSSTFTTDQFTPNIVKEAAITALGSLSNPVAADINAVVEMLAPPSNAACPASPVFEAAADAYWKIGTAAVLPAVLESLRTVGPDDRGLTVISLAAKFPPRELKSCADTLRTLFIQHANRWQHHAVRTDRLVDLTKKLASDDFFHEWSSRHGAKAMAEGRGKISIAMLEELDCRSESVAKSLLVLAQTLANVADDGPVLEGLRASAAAGHGRLIAATLLGSQADGHRHLIRSGRLFTLYPSMEQAVRATCEAIESGRDPSTQRSTAADAALGLLVAAFTPPSDANNATWDFGLLQRRANRKHRTDDREPLDVGVEKLKGLKRDGDPVVLVASRACPPVSSLGAAAIIETWMCADDSLSHLAMNVLVREAGRTNADPDGVPSLKMVEGCALKSEGRQQDLRESLTQALLAGIVVDGRLNRYALDLMQRENMAFERGADVACPQLRHKEDADFLLARLAKQGQAGLGVLTKAVTFQRNRDEKLTAHVRAKAIELSVALLLAGDKRESVESFARLLHGRFQDPQVVRVAAYNACGRLRSFVSIGPLRARLAKETDASARARIPQALTALRDALTQVELEQAKPEEIETWLAYVANLGDPVLLPQVVGYLQPPHADHSVRHAALRALESMKDPRALEAVKKFIDDTAPEGDTLAVARRARLTLEDRSDVDLFDVLTTFYKPDADVLNPSIDYERTFGRPLLTAVTRGLRKVQNLWEDGHWDEFNTKVSGVMEAIIRQVFRSKYAAMGADQQTCEKLAGGNSYPSMFNFTPFRNTYGRLQAYCNTIHSFRRDSPTAHEMNRDGSPKIEATEDDAESVRQEFLLAFAEAVKVLKS